MYTPKEYSDMAEKANMQNKMLYIMVDKDTNDETLVIADTGYYVTEQYSNRTYGELNSNFESNRINNIKELKRNNALIKAKNAINDGYIKLKNGIEIETNSDTVADLNTALIVMKLKELDTYIWIDKNDIAVELTENDLNDIIAEIGLWKNLVWAKYYEYIEQINSLKTYDEVSSIKLDFTKVDDIKTYHLCVDEEVEDDDFEEFEEFEEEI